MSPSSGQVFGGAHDLKSGCWSLGGDGISLVDMPGTPTFVSLLSPSSGVLCSPGFCLGNHEVPSVPQTPDCGGLQAKHENGSPL